MERWTKGSMTDAIGYRLVDLGLGWAKAELPFRRDLQQTTGVFQAAALVALADNCAGVAALSILCDDRGEVGGKMLYMIQASMNLVRNIASGKAFAESVVASAEQTTQVIKTRITDENGRLLVLFASTLLVVDRVPGYHSQPQS